MFALDYTRVAQNLAHALVQWCAPVLGGIKPSGMFNLGLVQQVAGPVPGCTVVAQGTREQAEAAVALADAELAERGVRLRLMAHRTGSSMVFAWRPDLLAAFIGRDPEATMLEVEGYDVSDVDACVSRLQSRVLSFDACPRNPDGTDRFPHEVGFLLGYPLEDVLGFVTRRPQALMRSWWNVYTDLPRAQRVFRTYDACTRLAQRRLAAGEEVRHIAADRAVSPHAVFSLFE